MAADVPFRCAACGPSQHEEDPGRRQINFVIHGVCVCLCAPRWVVAAMSRGLMCTSLSPGGRCSPREPLALHFTLG